jgi:quinol monooxygenase YgiN
MANGSIIIVAKMKAKAGMEETVKSELGALVKATLSEPGCIRYTLHRAKKDPASFLFYEEWASKEALGSHSQSPHFRSFGAKAKELLAEPADISFWQAVKD